MWTRRRLKRTGERKTRVPLTVRVGVVVIDLAVPLQSVLFVEVRVVPRRELEVDEEVLLSVPHEEGAHLDTGRERVDCREVVAKHLKKRGWLVQLLNGHETGVLILPQDLSDPKKLRSVSADRHLVCRAAVLAEGRVLEAPVTKPQRVGVATHRRVEVVATRLLVCRVDLDYLVSGVDLGSSLHAVDDLHELFLLDEDALHLLEVIDQQLFLRQRNESVRVGGVVVDRVRDGPRIRHDVVEVCLASRRPARLVDAALHLYRLEGLTEHILNHGDDVLDPEGKPGNRVGVLEDRRVRRAGRAVITEDTKGANEAI